MRVIPAIDLRDGCCVHLVGGNFERECVRIPNVMRVMRRWQSAGFTELHLVDLDAAAGRRGNTKLARRNHLCYDDPRSVRRRGARWAYRARVAGRRRVGCRNRDRPYSGALDPVALVKEFAA